MNFTETTLKASAAGAARLGSAAAAVNAAAVDGWLSIFVPCRATRAAAGELVLAGAGGLGRLRTVRTGSVICRGRSWVRRSGRGRGAVGASVRAVARRASHCLAPYAIDRCARRAPPSHMNGPR